MIQAWLIVMAMSGQPIVEKEIRVDPKVCHLPPIRAEYPVDGEFKPVTLKLKCK